VDELQVAGFKWNGHLAVSYSPADRFGALPVIACRHIMSASVARNKPKYDSAKEPVQQLQLFDLADA
jgi:hypothetical protein